MASVRTATPERAGSGAPPRPAKAGGFDPSPIFAGIYLLQVATGIALWAATAAFPKVHESIDLVAGNHAVTDGFFVPDMLIVLASAGTAWALLTHRPWAGAAAAFTAGAVLYPTLYLVGWILITSGATGSVALAIMIPPALINAFVCVQVWRHTSRART